MGLFEHFPFTNLHQLNLDWIIKQIKLLEQNAVLSVNGQTGDVILYQNPDIVFPDVDSNTWRMVRTANGSIVGIMFQNGLAYVMNGGQASRVYTVDDPPAYPVRSVNGQTGDVVTYPDAGIRFPDVDDGYMNMRRQIDSAGTPAIVGVQVDKTKAQRINGTNRYDIYDSQNQPPYPVSSVNGQTGAVILAIPFDAPLTDSIWMATNDSSDHTAGLGRETVDGTVELYTITDGTHAEAFIHFVSSDDQYNYTKKLLTTDDIPSASGVVSLNGMTGVVTITGEDLYIDSQHNVAISDILWFLMHDLAIVINGDKAVDEDGNYVNVSQGEYVIVFDSSITGVTDGIYTAVSNVSAGTSFTIANLSSVTIGGLNDLYNYIDSFKHSNDIVVEPIGTYFTRRTGFFTRKIGDMFVFQGYFNITTAVPNGTEFANTMRGSCSGTVGIVDQGNGLTYPATFNGGKIVPSVNIPTGYYYVVGCAIMTL